MRRHGLFHAILVAFCISLVAAGFAQGADRPSAEPAAAPGIVTPPSDPVARAAFDVLAKHCSRCHQEGPTLTKRLKPAKNFGDILKLDELAKTPQLILPGNPDASKLFTQIASQEMPYDLYNEFDTSVPEVSEADVKALRTWIESLGTAVLASCERRKFIRDGEVLSAIAADLEKLPRDRIKGTRYATLAHLFNACADEREMEVYRHGVVKLLNALSRGPNVVRLEAIGPERTVLRFNIDDLRWDAADWNQILAAYPYATQPDARLFSFVTTATGSLLPYVRGDWLAYTAAQPPLYEALLKIPPTFAELEKQQGLDVAEDIRRFLVQRAGFQKSGVSQNNRLIERHRIPTGFLWTSYDFAGNRERQNLFRFPLGPGGEFGFRHDGGETVFTLPNGFHGYALTTAKGDRLAKGPTQIVRDMTRKDLAVTNGISCMGCHDQGIRKARDEVREQVLADRSFPKSVRDAVEALYPQHDQMDRVLQADGEAFRAAVARAGLDPALKLNGVEPVNALAAKFEGDLDLRLAAAEFGLTPEELKQAAGGAGPRALALVRRLDQGLVPRDQFEADYAAFVPGLTDREMIDLRRVVAEKTVEPARPTAAPKELTRTFDLALTSDKSAYRRDELAVLTVVAQADCNLTLVNVDEKGIGKILFPNEFQRDNRIRARQEFQFPGPSAPFRFRLADAGVETVIAMCNASRPVTRGFEPDYTTRGFTDIGNYADRLASQIAVESKERSKTRQIRVEAGGAEPGGTPLRPPAASGVETAPALATSAPSEIVGRTAIKIKVQ